MIFAKELLKKHVLLYVFRIVASAVYMTKNTLKIGKQRVTLVV